MDQKERMEFERSHRCVLYKSTAGESDYQCFSSPLWPCMCKWGALVKKRSACNN